MTSHERSFKDASAASQRPADRVPIFRARSSRFVVFEV